MTHVSFIIPYHPIRTDNLLQTIRFIEAREDLLDGELIVVCNTRNNTSISSSFKDFSHIEANLPRYNKNTMLNMAINASKHEIIILLDSDRILPKGYFTRISKHINRGEVISTERLYNLKKPYSDQQIAIGAIEKTEDFRSKDNKMRRKNLFSGNTVIWKKDLLDCGAFDEEYNGYGFADTDMTKTVMCHGMSPVFLNEDELHLYHDKLILWNDSIISYEEFRVLTAINGMRYCAKWKIRPTIELRQLFFDIDNSLHQISHEIKELWFKNQKSLYL